MRSLYLAGNGTSVGFLVQYYMKKMPTEKILILISPQHHFKSGTASASDFFSELKCNCKGLFHADAGTVNEKKKSSAGIIVDGLLVVRFHTK